MQKFSLCNANTYKSASVGYPLINSLKAKAVLRGVVALCYGVNNKVLQLHTTQSKLLD